MYSCVFMYLVLILLIEKHVEIDSSSQHAPNYSSAMLLNISNLTKMKHRTPWGKFRKYFEMRQLSENTFTSFNMEVYEKFFF